MALKNSQYNCIMRSYEEKQLQNRHLSEKRIAEVYKKIPQYEELEASISSYSVSYAKKLLAGDSTALSKLKNTIADLGEQKALLLSMHGFPADYLDPVYQCMDCQDTGYIGNQKCHCFKQAVIDMLYTQSNIRRVLETENFEHFSFDYYNGQDTDPATGKTPLAAIQNAYHLAKNFIAGFGVQYENLFFYGTVGVGKTFLSNCIAKELIEAGNSVIYFTAFQLFDLLAKNTFDSHDNTEENETFYRHIYDCDLLIIDDLGTELTNTFVSSQLFLCINERHIRKKPTIISTNLSFDKLVETYSERTFSRITSNYKMIKLIGEDIRLKKKRMKT